MPSNTSEITLRYRFCVLLLGGVSEVTAVDSRGQVRDETLGFNPPEPPSDG